MKFLRITAIFVVVVAAFVLFMHFYYRIDRQATASLIENYYDSTCAGKAAATCKHTGIIAGNRNKFNWLTEVTFISNRDTVLNDPVLGRVELKKNVPTVFPVTFIFTRDAYGKWQNSQRHPGSVK